jgi:hypothetical protein
MGWGSRAENNQNLGWVEVMKPQFWYYVMGAKVIYKYIICLVSLQVINYNRMCIKRSNLFLSLKITSNIRLHNAIILLSLRNSTYSPLKLSS